VRGRGAFWITRSATPSITGGGVPRRVREGRRAPPGPLALDREAPPGHADPERVSGVPGAGAQGERHIEIGDGRELDWQVVAARPLIADAAAHDRDVAAVDVRLHRPGRAHADERVGPDRHELLDRDRAGRTADAGRGAGNGNALELAGPGHVFAVLGDEPRRVESPGDELNPRGVARQQHVPPDLARPDADVVEAAIGFDEGHGAGSPALLLGLSTRPRARSTRRGWSSPSPARSRGFGEDRGRGRFRLRSSGSGDRVGRRNTVVPAW
jgi:hypothetical protein